MLKAIQQLKIANCSSAESKVTLARIYCVKGQHWAPFSHLHRDESCSVGNSCLQIIWTDNPLNKCETVEANCDSSSALSSHSWLHFLLYESQSVQDFYISSEPWEVPPPSAAGQGPLKDGGGRWMTDGQPWRIKGHLWARWLNIACW